MTFAYETSVSTPQHRSDLTGKGRKTRIVPLLSDTVELLEGYLREHQLNRANSVDSPLFFNQRGEHLSRSGVRYILEKYTMQARKTADLFLTSVTPHTLRRSLQGNASTPGG